MNPSNVHLLDREPVVAAILWGNHRRLKSLTDHGKNDSNGRAHVGDAIRHKPEMLGFLRQIGFMGATT